MTTKWREVPLWTVARENRHVVEPAILGDHVYHYSIPSIDEIGTGRLERTDQIKSAKLQLRGGEILISKLNPRKSRVVEVRAANIPSVASTEFVSLYASEALNTRFLAYLLQSETVRQVLDSRVQSVTRSHQRVDPAEIMRLMIALPELWEQRRIADFLDAETARSEHIRQTTSRQASVLSERLSESIRLLTTVGSGEWRDTGIPWMPRVGQDWRLIKVSHAFTTGSGTTPTSDQVDYYDGPHPWVNSADVNDAEIGASQKSVTDKALKDFPSLQLHPPGSLVIAMYGQGATKGRVGILRISACLNQACCALIPTGAIIPEYAAYWFRAHKDGIVGLAYGAGQPNLSQELIRQLRIPVPKLSGQLSIVGEIRSSEEKVQQEILLLQERERLLVERQQALISAAVTGSIDVSTAVGRR